MLLAISIINAFILAFLSGIHFYWASGGQWGLAGVLPTDKKGKQMLNPKTIDSIIVATGLLGFTIYLLIYTELIDFYLPSWIFDYGIWFIIAIFLLRTIGDFRYIGFFKKVKGTDFARKDTIYYSPLCLWLGLSSLVLKWASC